MYYSELANVYEKLEKTSERLKKTQLIAELFKKSDTQTLPKIVLLMQGKLFPAWSEKEIGLSDLSMAKILSMASGFSASEVNEIFKKTGDYGLVAEKLMLQKKQKTLFRKPLTIDTVYENLTKTASMEGKGSQDRKFRLISELLTSANPKEAKYITRTVIGDLRIGVAEGVVRDAIVIAFLNEEKKDLKDLKDKTKIVEWAWFLRPDYGEIAKIAKEKGIEGLKKVRLEVGKPYHVLLAEKSPGLKEALNSFKHVVLEYKYDGVRIIIHKKGNTIWLYTRRMENVTKQFPEVVDFVKRAVNAEECIIEGEMLGFDKKTGTPIPFQYLSQRIKRKYNIERMIKEIPVQVNLFDIVYLNGKELFDEPLRKRKELLKNIVKPIGGKFQLAKALETKNLKLAEKFYKEALNAKQEGVMVKNLDAKYQPGRRVAGGWLKVKPVMENLDLVIIGAQWGSGKRVGVLSSFVLGCLGDNGNFLECGMIGTGIKEKEETGISFKQLTDLLKPHIIGESGNTVKIKPMVVVEVAYEEIQKSPNYTSGFALRFPRVVRIREDKGVEDADSIRRIEKLYNMQFKKKQIINSYSIT